MENDHSGAGKQPAPAMGPGFPSAARVPRGVVVVLRRVPFTVLVILAVLLSSAVAGLLGRPLSPPQLARWGFGWADLTQGHPWRLLSAPLFILKPYMALSISAILLFFVGSCEMLLKTRRTVTVFLAGHVVGYVGALLLLQPLGRGGWVLAQQLAIQRDVGASNGAFGAAGALLIFLPRGLRSVGLLLFGAYLGSALLLEQKLWDVQHILALLTGMGLGLVFLRRDDRHLVGPRLGGDLLHRQRALLLSWLVGGMGLVNVMAAVLLPQHPGFARLESALPLGLHHGPRLLLVCSGLLLLIVAGALSRSQRAAWWAAFLALLLTLGLQMELGVNKLEAVFALAFLLLMVAWKEDFTAPVDPPSLLSARNKALGVLVGVPTGAWLAAVGLRAQFSAYDDATAALLDVGRRLFYLAPLTLLPTTRAADWLLEAIPLVFWSGVLLVAGLALRAIRAPHPAEDDFARARGLALAHGATGTSFMATWPGNHLFFGPDREAFLAYRLQAGTAVVLGDPVGAPSSRAAALREFNLFCRQRGWAPVILGATGAERQIYTEGGFQLLPIGEEAILDLAGLEFKGRKWQNMRTALNRARKLGVEFRLYQGGRIPVLVEMQMRDLELDWRRQQMLPPLEFTQGRVDDTRDPAVEVAVALDGDGVLHGYVDWLPIPAGKGWVIDLMRRSPEAMSGTMEFLIGMSLLTFQERGDAFASLAAAPLAPVAGEPEDGGGVISQLLGIIFKRFETFYDFRSLFDFKDRFEPRWEPVYLAYGDPSTLPAVAVAILRAHLPDLGWSQAVRLLGEVLARRLRLQDETPAPAESATTEPATPPPGSPS